MQTIFTHAKGFFLCLSAACSLQANAQYLEHIYDYVENTAVFEEDGASASRSNAAFCPA